MEEKSPILYVGLTQAHIPNSYVGKYLAAVVYRGLDQIKEARGPSQLEVVTYNLDIDKVTEMERNKAVYLVRELKRMSSYHSDQGDVGK